MNNQLKLHLIWPEQHSHKALLGAYIWAELATEPETVPAQLSTPKMHPQAASADEIRMALKGYLPKQKARAQDCRLFLWIPTNEKGPYLSDTSQPAEDSMPFGQWWEVEALYVEGDSILDMVDAVTNNNAFTCGPSWDYWKEVKRFVLRLIANQSFAPSIDYDYLKSGSRRFHAVWLPIYLEHEYFQLETICKALPLQNFYFSDQPISARNTPYAPNYDRKDAARFVKSTIAKMLDVILRKMFAKAGIQVNLEDISKNSRVQDWLTKLLTEKSALDKKAQKTMPSFAAKIQHWQRKEADANYAAGNLMTTLRIIAPKEDQDNDTASWGIEMCVSPIHHPHIVIPLRAILDKDSHDSEFIETEYGSPFFPIEDSLDYLVELLPGLKHMLEQGALPYDNFPTEIIPCTKQDIMKLIGEKLKELNEQDIRVELPGWHNTAPLKYRLHLKKPSQHSLGIMGEDAIVAYDWQVAIGDHQMSLKEFERIVEQKEALLKLKGNVVYLDQKKAAQMLAFLKKASSDENINIGQALKKGYANIDHDDFVFDGIEADPWAETFLLQLKKPDSIARIEPPKSFTGTLRPYQTVGLSWLKFLSSCKLGACLADDMGLGKTVQIIAWLSYKKDVLKEKGPTLLICPMSVMSNWQSELTRFNSSLTVMLHHGAQRSHANFFKEGTQEIAYDIIITSYATAMRDQEFLQTVQWNTIVIDEAQNIKNPETKQTSAIKSLNAHNKIALTGTPVENRLTELWSIIDFINPGYLGSLRSFNKTFAYPIEVTKDVKVQRKLKELIGPCLLRRTKNDKTIIQDLPEKIEEKVFCTLTKEQAALYQGVVKAMLEGLKDTKGFARAGQVLRTLTQLKQICNHPDQLLGGVKVDPEKSGKIVRLLELLDEVIAEGDKVLIFTQFKQMGDILVEIIKKAFNQEILFLHGGCTKKARDDLIASFSKPNGPQVFVLSLKAGGTGLNLVQANHVFHIDRWWNPAVENQATDRAYRIGQTRMVQVHKFICKGTLEERIDVMIEKKQKLASDIISDSEQWITQLSDRDLEALVTLDTKVL